MCTRRTLVTTVGLVIPAAVAAHLPPGATGPHGGQVQILGAYHGELVVRDGELALYLFDHHERPLDARQASGTVVVLADGRRESLLFAPRADGSALIAVGEIIRPAPGLRVVVKVVPARDLAEVQARFTPAGPLR